MDTSISLTEDSEMDEDFNCEADIMCETKWYFLVLY